MTAINMGASAPNPFQALAERIRMGTSHGLSKREKRTLPHEITFEDTRTGIIAKRGGVPVAWICCGYHRGESDNKPKTCRFVDVAYFRENTKGINLETADFDTLPEALDFVTATFNSKGGAA